MTEQPYIDLNDGTRIPQFGFGTWQIPAADTARLVGEAIRLGYRLIDTAQMYENEEGVGRAVAEADVPRDELYVTTKLRNRSQGYDTTLKAFDESMDKLGLEVLDLFLIHWPQPMFDDYSDSWKAFVRLQQEGRVRSIGVSNFNQDHLERIIGETGVTPAVNQIELHPRFQQLDKRAYHRQHDIKIQSWSPLGRGNVLDREEIAGIAHRHGKTPAQVVLRWHIEQGLIVFPKSVTPARIAENIDIFDFELDSDEMETIGAMDDAGGRSGANPETNDWRG